MASWPPLTARGARAGLLFVSGSRNPESLASLRDDGVERVGASVRVLDGADHDAELTATDRVLPIAREFLLHAP